MSEPWPTSRHVDMKTGKVRCFDIPAGKYVDKYPVDVREGVTLKTIARFAPEEAEAEEEKQASNTRITIEDIDKANAKTLEKIVADLKLNVNLSEHEKLADKREAVKEALKA